MAEYGPRVLGQPEDEGFGLAAWLVPIARRARGARARDPHRPALAASPGEDVPAAAAGEAGAAGTGLDPDDARRLDAELAAFDR